MSCMEIEADGNQCTFAQDGQMEWAGIKAL